MPVVTFRVVDSRTNRPIQNAAIVVFTPRPVQDTTGADGTCDVNIVPPNTYSYRVVHADYETVRENIDGTHDHGEIVRLNHKAPKRQPFLGPTKERLRITTPTGAGATAFISTYLLEIIIGFAAALTGYFWFFRHLPGIWGLVLPVAVFIITVFSTRGRGTGRTVGYGLLILVFFILASGLINAITSGNIYQMEWWLSKLNFLRWLGVPTSFIENFKTGVTNVLSYLNIKAIQPSTPQAEKIGGYQALEVKFGSKYTDYSIPTLYADGPTDAGYSIPVTISNPNPIDSDLTVRDFSLHSLNLKETATEVDMRTTKSGLVGKIMCGSSDTCKLGNLCNIEPQREEQIILTFEHYAPCTTLPNSIHLVDIYDKEECEKKYDCEDPPFISTKGEWKTRGVEGEGCYCEKKREKNNFTELCDELRFGDKVAIEFASKFTFSATGSSEFRILEKEENIKIAPQPKIKTSSGPVDITIYFIPDYISNEKPRDAVKMIVNVANKGGGRADITEVKPLETTSPVSVNFGDCVDRIKKITSVNDGEERPAICDVKFPQGTAISGPYVTIPISIDIKYTYEKIESVAIPITRYEYDPSDPLQEGFAGSTGYCPKS